MTWSEAWLCMSTKPACLLAIVLHSSRDGKGSGTEPIRSAVLKPAQSNIEVARARAPHREAKVPPENKQLQPEPSAGCWRRWSGNTSDRPVSLSLQFLPCAEGCSSHAWKNHGFVLWHPLKALAKLLLPPGNVEATLSKPHQEGGTN